MIEEDGQQGFAECVPYSRYGETSESVITQIDSILEPISKGATSDQLQSLLPAGAARNAIDCALWDLKAKQSNASVGSLTGLGDPPGLTSAQTISIGTVEEMASEAIMFSNYPVLKAKLNAEDILERVNAIHSNAPNSQIIIDANEGWDAQTYRDLAPVLVKLGVRMVEQPMPSGNDDALLEVERVLPVCADESCHDRNSLAALAGKYDMVNIKLDKTGGLTEALKLRAEAEAMGFEIMVGCMVGSSLAMAPATLVAQGVAYTDLDGPLLLAEDRSTPLKFDDKFVYPPEPALWG